MIFNLFKKKSKFKVGDTVYFRNKIKLDVVAVYNLQDGNVPDEFVYVLGEIGNFRERWFSYQWDISYAKD